MFCQTCGNNIPDDVTVCPHCGQAVSADDDMSGLLSELTLTLDSMENGAASTQTAEAAPASQNTYAEEPAAEAPAEAAENSDLISGAMNVAETAAATEAVRPRATRTAAPREQRPVKKAPQKAPASGKKAAPSGQKKKSSAAASQKGRKKKKKKKKKGGSAVLGVIIGLLVALLLIALAAGYMLFKLGFFDSLNATDEELLYNSAAEMPSTTETTILPDPSPVPETSTVEEAPVADSAAEAAADAGTVDAAEAEPAEEAAAPAAVQVNAFELNGDQETELTFYSRGETAEISYYIDPEEASSAIEWTSDDTSVATVSESGVINARRGGSCTITGTCGDLSVSIAVTCSFSVPDSVLDMNYEDITMSYEGQTVQLEVEGGDMLTEENSIYWESSDEAVATVDDAGLVTAVADGTAIISASYGDYTASCIVRCVNVTGTIGVNSTSAPYAINYDDVTLSRKGEYFQLKLTSIDGGEDPEVTWVSDDKSIATVDSKGVVTAVANGTCNITTTIDGYDFQCIVRVNIAG